MIRICSIIPCKVVENIIRYRNLHLSVVDLMPKYVIKVGELTRERAKEFKPIIKEYCAICMCISEKNLVSDSAQLTPVIDDTFKQLIMSRKPLIQVESEVNSLKINSY